MISIRASHSCIHLHRKKIVRDAVDRVVQAKLSAALQNKKNVDLAALKRQIWKDCMKTVDGMIAEMDSMRFIRLDTLYLLFCTLFLY
jgi:hypothetical protein